MGSFLVFLMNAMIRLVLLLGPLVLALGCGGPSEPKLVQVKGKITYKGQALPGGTVAFLGSGGYRAVAPIMRDGQYSLKAPLGDVQVAVVTRTPTPEKMKKGQRPAVREVNMPPGVNPKSLPPEKYERFDTSGLTATVKEDGQTIDLPLE